MRSLQVLGEKTRGLGQCEAGRQASHPSFPDDVGVTEAELRPHPCVGALRHPRGLCMGVGVGKPKGSGFTVTAFCLSPLWRAPSAFSLSLTPFLYFSSRLCERRQVVSAASSASSPKVIPAEGRLGRVRICSPAVF